MKMSCSNFDPEAPSTSVTNLASAEEQKNVTESNECKKSVTVLISDSGEITYDEETLQSIIDSDQELTTVTFLRVEGSKNSKTNDTTTANMSTNDASHHELSANLNEDSMDAANAILDAAAINPTIDQGAIINENIAGSANNPIAMLNQEQISRLEKVLQSDEAKTFLGDVLGTGNSSNNIEDEISTMGNIDESQNLVSSAPLNSSSESQSTEQNESGTMKNDLKTDDMQTSSSESDVDRKKTGKGRGGLAKGARRSQRQIDKEMKEEAERIRKENQALLQKEREQMKSSSSTASSVTEESIEEQEKVNVSQKDATHDTPHSETSHIGEKSNVSCQSQVPSRPKRERKMPLHMQGGDFVYGSAGTQKDLQSKKTVETTTKKSDFKLSKILPSPSKIVASQTSKEEQKSSSDHSEIMNSDTNADNSKDDSDDKKETDEETSDGDWNSEDDPERLWCICQQPHNNRFMICCDSCLDWYHGKCVGITKKMGKEMEDAGNEWRCPTCKKKEKANDALDKIKSDLELKIEAKVQKEHEKQLQQEKRSPNKITHNGKLKTHGSKKRPGSALSNDGKDEKKLKERTCFVCEKPPRPESIFCSDECIGKHVERAKEFLMKTKPKNVLASKRPELPSTFPGSDKIMKAQRVMVMEPKTNTLISASAPNAPTEETLSTWLMDHPTFHVVMPKDVPTSKFYGAEKTIQKKIVKPPTMSIERQKQRQKEKANVDKRLKEYQKHPALMTSINDHSISHSFNTNLELKTSPTNISLVKSSITDAAGNKLAHSSESSHLKKTPSHAHLASSEEKLHRSVSGSSLGSSERRKRRPSDDQFPKKRRDSEAKSNVNRITKQLDYAESDFDPAPLRKNVTKGLKDALKTRVENTEGVAISNEELDRLVKNIEDALYKYYNKDVGSKYKSKYRSLVFNIKDPKNNGLFRKIIRKEYSANRIVSMTAEEMANKELKEWRQAELKHDIEKIKSHEMEMAQIGTKLVMKTHKGDMVMEDGKESSMVELKNDEVMLPDEVKLEEIHSSSRAYGIKTWEHGSHSFESQCDVCTAKITLDDFLIAKIDREKKKSTKTSGLSEHKQSSKPNSSSSEHRHKKSREDSNRHRKSSSSHRRHSGSSRHKSTDSSQSKDKGSKDDVAQDNLNQEGSMTNKESHSNHEKKEHVSQDKHSSSENNLPGDSNAIERAMNKQKSDNQSSSHRRDSKSSSSSHKRRHSSSKDKSHSSSSKNRKESAISEKEKDINRERRSSHSLNRREEKLHTSQNNDTNKEAFSKSNSVKPRSDTSKLKGTVNDGDESMRKEVTEEDVAKAESLIKKITSSSAIIQHIPEYDDGSEAVPNASSDIEQADSSANDSITEIVSSTVTIKTPDTSGLNVALDNNPIVWKGDIHMPDVAKFSVTAKQVSGTTDYLTVDLKDALKIVGRIAPKTVWDYIAQISESPSKEILLVKLEPSTHDETNNYTTFYNYLQQRNRLGVVGNNSKMVKDCYILPLSSTDKLNEALLPLDGPGIEDPKSDMLLALVVRTRRKRPGDSERDAERQRIQLSKKSKNELMKSDSGVTILDNISEKQNIHRGGIFNSPSIMDNEIEILSPEISIKNNSNNEKAVQKIEDMEIEVLFEENSSNVNQNDVSPLLNRTYDKNGIMKNQSINDMNITKLDTVQKTTNVPCTTSDNHNSSITAKMDQLNRQIEKQKAEIALVKSKVSSKGADSSSANTVPPQSSKTVDGAGFQGLPQGIASILFGEGLPSRSDKQEILGLSDIHGETSDTSSIHRDPRKNQTKSTSPKQSNSQRSLSSLTDADLLAKAAAQLPSEMIVSSLDKCQRSSSTKKKHKYPPLLPELDSPPISPTNILPKMQLWDKSQALYEASKTSTAPQIDSWSFNKESESFHHYDNWQSSAYYDAYEVGCGTSSNWPLSGGYIVQHNKSNDTWQKTLVATTNDTQLESTSSCNNQLDQNHSKDINLLTGVKESNNSFKVREPDPRPPGEEDRSFDTSFDKIIQNKSQSKEKYNEDCRTSADNLTETVTDIVARLSR